jgi:hypothetical protein
MQKIFPANEFKRVPSGHAALRSYYLLRRIGGVRIVSPTLESITLGNAMPVVYCQNDLGGAWERDQVGKWTNACTPGGEAQRKDAFHLGINLILYAMTENYKDDLIHVRSSASVSLGKRCKISISSARCPFGLVALIGVGTAALLLQQFLGLKKRLPGRPSDFSHAAARGRLYRTAFLSSRSGIDRQAREPNCAGR